MESNGQCPEKPPCGLASVDECTAKTALECLSILKATDFEYKDLPKAIGRSQSVLEEGISCSREQLKKCLVERFLSGQFGAPTGPLRR